MYDSRCDELARHFLPAGTSEQLIEDLAQRIQIAIEDWIAERAEQMTAQLKEGASD